MTQIRRPSKTGGIDVGQLLQSRIGGKGSTDLSNHRGGDGGSQGNGRGFLEAAYQEALELEFADQGIPFGSQIPLSIRYKGRILKCTYRADFVCFGEVIVEIKALSQITGVERAQAINYLRPTGFHRALILNFGTSSLQYERVVLNA
jgi:GxxExxY protein